jgi:SPP1 family holin
MDKGTLVRIIVFVAAWLNNYLVQKGFTALPVLSEEVVAQVVAFVVSAYTLWRNNYITKKGKKQKEVIDKYGLK